MKMKEEELEELELHLTLWREEMEHYQNLLNNSEKELKNEEDKVRFIVNWKRELDRAKRKIKETIVKIEELKN